MSNKKSRRSTCFDNGVMNAFAIIMTVLPILSIGFFVHTQFFDDPRTVSSLTEIPASTEPRLFEEPLVSVTFDDGWESVYTKAAPLLQQYSIRTTQYILLGEFGSRSYISLDQAKSLKHAGHEIMSHTMTHVRLTSATDDKVRSELEGAKSALIQYGLSTGDIQFAAPESATNAKVDAVIKDMYASHRNTLGDIQNGVDSNDVNVRSSAFDRYNIIGYAVRPETTALDIRIALAYAHENNGWLVLVYHQIDDSKETYSVSAAKLDKHLQLIKESGIKTATIGDVLAHQKVGL